MAVRPRTLGASTIPVLIGSAVAAASGSAHLRIAMACLATALLLQIAANLSNDASDFVRGIDTDARMGPTRVTQAGLLSPVQVFGAAALCVVLADRDRSLPCF